VFVCKHGRAALPLVRPREAHKTKRSPGRRPGLRRDFTRYRLLRNHDQLGQAGLGFHPVRRRS
jgi:hypothetical protein